MNKKLLAFTALLATTGCTTTQAYHSPYVNRVVHSSHISTEAAVVLGGALITAVILDNHKQQRAQQQRDQHRLNQRYPVIYQIDGVWYLEEPVRMAPCPTGEHRHGYPLRACTVIKRTPLQK